MIDTHAHLFFDELYNDLDNIIEEAKKSGIKYIICPSTNLETARKTLEIANKYPMVYAAIGVHPHDTSNFDDNTLLELEKLLNHPKVVAIGEIGLDYYYDYSPVDKQQFAFREQLKLAKRYKLPVIIHNRESSEDVMKIFEDENDGNLFAQFHCFSGNFDMAYRIVELHSFISFTGNITFMKNEELRKILSRIEPENLLLETDSPFMSPIPFRGKVNKPSNLKVIVEKIAELQGLTMEDIIRSTNFSAFKLFKIGELPSISFTYQIGKALYVNVTNRCNASCVFCDREGYASVAGYNLRMSKSQEPLAEVYIQEIGDPKKYSEVVFCGFGEPTIRLDIIKEVARYVKENGGKTRLNTNGHGNFINKRNILPELKGLIDSISISLNSADPEQYAKLMKVDKSLFYEMVDFTKEAKKYIDDVIVTIVDLREVDEQKARKFAEKELGVRFRERELF